MQERSILVDTSSSENVGETPPAADRAGARAAKSTGDDDARTDRSSPGKRKSLLQYLRPVRALFCVSLLLLICISALTAAKALISQPIVDAFLGGEPTTGELAALCFVALSIFWLQGGLEWAYSVLARIASARVVQSVRSELFNNLLNQGTGFFSTQSSSQLATRIVNDIAVFEVAAIGAIQLLIRDLVTVILLLGVIFFNNPGLAAICIGVVFLAAAILKFTGRRVRAIGRTVQDSLGEIAKNITEMIGGIAVILGFGLRDRWKQDFEGTNENYRDMVIKAQKISATSVLALQLVAGATIATVLWLTGQALLAKEITEGQFMSLLATLYLLQAPAQGIPGAVNTINRGVAAGDRALEILEFEPELEFPTDGPPIRTPSAGRVQFERVDFSYGAEPILRDLSIEIQAGKVTVMVGDSGAGKSTVAKLAQRFHDPHAGRVTLDGVPLPELTRAQLVEAISYVAQDVFVFDGTLEENLRIGNMNASMSELDDAMRIACLDDFVEELPNGLRTEIGERGTRLSGGQRQRIAIARAVLADTRVLILDEATSALDMELEQRILQNLVDHRAGQTIFAITHRLSLAEVADQVIVLKDGVLAESGTAQDLAAAGGEYARLQYAATSKLQR
ncbi:MAG: ABC transporter ATP-binding protein [Planctomycetota bacterium]